MSASSWSPLGSATLKAGREDEAKHSQRGLESREPKHPIIQHRDMYTPDLYIDALKVAEFSVTDINANGQ